MVLYVSQFNIHYLSLSTPPSRFIYNLYKSIEIHINPTTDLHLSHRVILNCKVYKSI